MKKFSDLGIVVESDKNMLDCPQVPISSVINCEIEVLGYIKDIKTKFGESRIIVHFKQNDKEFKFFTNSGSIKSTLNLINCTDFPFLSVIKQVSIGNNKTYKFT